MPKRPAPLNARIRKAASAGTGAKLSFEELCSYYTRLRATDGPKSKLVEKMRQNVVKRKGLTLTGAEVKASAKSLGLDE